MADSTRRPGRPGLDQASGSPTASVHLKLPAQVYDDVYKLAQRQRGSTVQDVIRLSVKRLLASDRGGTL